LNCQSRILRHASSVPFVHYPQTGNIAAHFDIAFNDWFATVPAYANKLPYYDNNCWQLMFKDLTYQQYVLSDEDEESLIVELVINKDYEQDVTFCTWC
jgi:hypothetical protein